MKGTAKRRSEGAARLELARKLDQASTETLHGGCGSEVTESPCFPRSQGSMDFMQKTENQRDAY